MRSISSLTAERSWICRGAICALVSCAVLSSLVGCNKKSGPKQLSEEMLEEVSYLPGLRDSTNEKLREHLARLEEASLTPRLLSRGEIAPTDNVATPLLEAFSGGLLKSQVEKSEELFPKHQFKASTIDLERMIRFRKTLEQKRQLVADALNRPHCDFGIDYTKGWSIDTNYLDAVRVYTRVEAFLAAEHLSDGKVQEATDALFRIFRVLECLADERAVSPRLLAGQLRNEVAISLLDAIVMHPKANSQLVERIYRRVEVTLANWPDDDAAWIGDRAFGLVSYEVIRNGELLRIISPDEAQMFLDENIYADISKAAVRGADDDELFYLNQMEKIIASCNEGQGSARKTVPYYRRKAVFDDFRNTQEVLRQDQRFPFIAARLLMKDIEMMHQRQAIDRTNVEMWALALAAAVDLPRAKYMINGLNGEKYTVKVDEQRVEVTGGEADTTGHERAVRIPNFQRAAK